MIAIRFRHKDLEINVKGETYEEAINKLLDDLAWWREYYPMRNYPEKPKKFKVYNI